MGVCFWESASRVVSRGGGESLHPVRAAFMGRGSESRGVGQTPLFPELGSGQYVSYWNAFLFVSVSISSKNVNSYQMLCFLITLITLIRISVLSTILKR